MNTQMVVLLAAEDGEITRLGLKYKPGRASRLHKCSSTTSRQTRGGDNMNSHAIRFPPALVVRRTLLAHPHCSGSPPPFGYRPHAYLTEARHLQHARVCSSCGCRVCPGLPDFVVHIGLVLYGTVVTPGSHPCDSDSFGVHSHSTPRSERQILHMLSCPVVWYLTLPLGTHTHRYGLVFIDAAPHVGWGRGGRKGGGATR